MSLPEIRVAGGSVTYEELLVLKRAGFKPPQGPGRCGWCGFHTPTQKHRDGCPMKKESK